VLVTVPLTALSAAAGCMPAERRKKAVICCVASVAADTGVEFSARARDGGRYRVKFALIPGVSPRTSRKEMKREAGAWFATIPALHPQR
jgi:hypothetical protein